MIISQNRTQTAQHQILAPIVIVLLKFSLVWDFIRDNFGIENIATAIMPEYHIPITMHIWAEQKTRQKTRVISFMVLLNDKLDKIFFPLGELTKKEVRGIATELNLTVAEKSESMELCFAGQGDYRAVLNCGEIDLPGDILDMQGNKIATHKGIANYTLGQRQGIGYAGGSRFTLRKSTRKLIQ